MPSSKRVNRQQSIHYRLLLWLVIPLTLIAIAVSVDTYYSAKKTAIRLHDQTLLSVMLVVTENVISTEGDLLSENILEALTDNLGDQYFYHAVGPDNVFVTGYTGVPPIPDHITSVGVEPLYYDSVYQSDPVRVVTMKRLVSEQEYNGWMSITAWQRTGQRDGLTFEIFTRSVLLLLFMIACAGVIVWIAVTQGLKPLQRLQRSIERRSPDDLSPIKGPVPVEVNGVVGSMNKLFSQVAKSNQVRERFLGDAAHQLRNPIAALKTQSEAALDNQTLDEFKSSISKIASTSRMTGKLIDQMLVSARAHAQNPELAEIYQPAEVVRQAAEQAAYRAMKKNHEYTLQIRDESLQIRGYPALLKEALMNLIDNAITHNEESTEIEIGLRRSADGQKALIYVFDNGRNIEQDEFERLLEPFSTGTNSKGSGLGLSVVNDIAHMHGGALILETMPEGETGKSMVIDLPAVDVA